MLMDSDNQELPRYQNHSNTLIHILPLYSCQPHVQVVEVEAAKDLMVV